MQQLSTTAEPAPWATLTPLPTASSPSPPPHPPAPLSPSSSPSPPPYPPSSPPPAPPICSPTAQPRSQVTPNTSVPISICSATLCQDPLFCFSLLFLPPSLLANLHHQALVPRPVCQSPNGCPASGPHLLDCSPLPIPSQQHLSAVLLHGKWSLVSCLGPHALPGLATPRHHVTVHLSPICPHCHQDGCRPWREAALPFPAQAERETSLD